MPDYNKLQSKIESFKAIIASNSITPLSLGSILSEFLNLIIETDDTAIRQQLQTLITAEAEKRGTDDAELGNRIDTLDDHVTDLENQLNTLMGGNVSEAIDNFNEVIDFLEGCTDDETLIGLLGPLRLEVSQLATALETETAGRQTADQTLSIRVGSVELAGLENSRAIESLSGAVDDHYRHVGIVGFDAVVDHHDSVLTGGPADETLEGLFSNGLVPHVIFVRSLGRFVFEIHDSTYDCPEGDAYETWPRADEFYDPEGAVRADRLYRCGGRLFRYVRGQSDEGVGRLVEYVDDDKLMQETSKLLSTEEQTLTEEQTEQVLTNLGHPEIKLFGQMWESIGGTVLTNGKYQMTSEGKELTLEEALVRYERNEHIERWRLAGKIGSNRYCDYNEMTCLYECNGLKDITHNESINIYETSYKGIVKTLEYIYSSSNERQLLRTFLPIFFSSDSDAGPYYFGSINGIFQYQSNLEVFRIVGYFDKHIAYPKSIVKSFRACSKLRKIELNLYYCTSADRWTFNQNYALKELYLSNLKISISLHDSKKITLESFQYIIENASNTSTITITVHPSVYKKITGAEDADYGDDSAEDWTALLGLALEKNITFATV